MTVKGNFIRWQISTDFNAMGKLAAKSIIENENILQKNKFRFIERKSL